MKILAAIAHYYKADGGSQYGSLSAESAPRVAALKATLLALREVAGAPNGMFYPPERRVVPANGREDSELRVVVCTAGDDHLLGSLGLPANLYRHHKTAAEPMLLGFECHDVLRRGLGRFDYFCYLEDDIVVKDPWFFRKLNWFGGWAGPTRILQPNRYEVSIGGLPKVYIDGDIAPKFTAAHQNLDELAELYGRAIEQPLRFRASSNPHSGCFFLAARQMRHWAEQKHFLDRDTGFMGPLESAATLGLLKTFEIYKPAPECADFLEVRHADNRYLDNRVRISKLPASDQKAAKT